MYACTYIHAYTMYTSVHVDIYYTYTVVSLNVDLGVTPLLLGPFSFPLSGGNIGYVCVCVCVCVIVPAVAVHRQWSSVRNHF